IAHLIADHGVEPGACLAITFTNRAAEEMRERLAALLPGAGAAVPVMTFHALALSMLREHRQRCGLHRGFRIATGEARDRLAAGERATRRLLARIAAAKRARATVAPDSDLGRAMSAYAAALDAGALIDFDDVLLLACDLLADGDVRAAYQARYRQVSIDEYQ